MTKHDFLMAVRAHAEGTTLPPHELEKMLEYYSEMIDEAMEEGATEEEAVEKLGSWSEIIGQINAACENYDSTQQSQTPNTEIHTEFKQKEQAAAPVSSSAASSTAEPEAVRGYIHIPWLRITLLIVTFPFWFTILVMLGSILFAFFCVVGSLMVMFSILAVALIIAGIITVPASLILLATNGFTSFALAISMTFLMVGIGILCKELFVGLIWLFKKLMHFSGVCFQKLFH